MSTFAIGLLLMVCGIIGLLVAGFLYLTKQETNEVERIFRELRSKDREA